MKIELNTPTVFSEIYIGEKVIEEHLPRLLQGQKNFVLTDTNVYRLYPAFFERWFSGCEIFVLTAGEESKNFAVLERILEKMIGAGMQRNGKLFAVGGGVIGDIGGLCAALYMRGIACVQIPTTLLAMVDSSVGGKTAVDMGGVKNVVGAFHQPETVLINPSFLDTLPEREWKCGVGEIVKCAALDAGLFDMLEGSNGLVRKSDIERWIEGCVRLKAGVVERDEKENGERKCLNLGHTTAHAIELSYGLSHGESVLWGMKIETELAIRRDVCDSEYGEKLLGFVENAISMQPFTKLSFADLDKLTEKAVMDKKNNGSDTVVMTVPADYGKWSLLSLPMAEYAEELSLFVKRNN